MAFGVGWRYKTEADWEVANERDQKASWKDVLSPNVAVGENYGVEPLFAFVLPQTDLAVENFRFHHVLAGMEYRLAEVAHGFVEWQILGKAVSESLDCSENR
jgi:hypothetical protein